MPIVRSMAEGLALGPTAVLIGIAPQGGRLPEEWRSWLAEALDRGCDLWSGLHTFLSDDPVLAAKAAAKGRKILDLRKPPADLPIASGLAKEVDPLVVLTVGTDCNVGKMTAQLQITRGLNERGLRTRFVATGQTGIMIEGWGIAVDAVVADFIAGAAERLVLEGSQRCRYRSRRGAGKHQSPGLLRRDARTAARLLSRRIDPVPPVEPGVHRRLPPGGLAPDPSALGVHPAVREHGIGGASDQGHRDLAQYVRPDGCRGAKGMPGRHARDGPARDGSGAVRSRPP